MTVETRMGVCMHAKNQKPNKDLNKKGGENHLKDGDWVAGNRLRGQWGSVRDAGLLSRA